MEEHVTSGKAIRNFCQKCVNSALTRIIKECDGEMVMATKKPCALYKYRLKGKGNVKAIRRNCVDCMGGSFGAVEDCQTTDCDLHPYRMGKNKWIIGGVTGRFKPQNQF